MKQILLIVFALIVLAACNSKKPPRDATMVELNSLKQKEIGSAQAGVLQLANMSLSVPDAWLEEAPSNEMRITQFKLKAHPEYEVVVSYFGNMENMVEANIERWKSQFVSMDEYRELEVEPDGVSGIKISGTFKLKPFPMAQDFTETDGYGTLAAIVPSDEGPYFLKLTAPVEVINKEEAAFVQCLNSVKYK